MSICEHLDVDRRASGFISLCFFFGIFVIWVLGVLLVFMRSGGSSLSEGLSGCLDVKYADDAHSVDLDEAGAIY